MVLHYNAASGWELIKPTDVEDGSLTFKTKSLSPISVVKLSVQDTSDDDDGDDTNTSVSGTTGSSNVVRSPKTGESVPFAAAILTISAAGAVVALRKRNA